MSPITIERIETRLVDLPTIRPHKLSVATMHGQTLMLVKVLCSDGVTGLGEGTTIAGMAYGPESPEAMKLDPIVAFCRSATSRPLTFMSAPTLARSSSCLR